MKLPEKINKREFLGKVISGTGVTLAGLYSFDLFAKKMIPMESTAGTGSTAGARYERESPYQVVTPRGVQCRICPNNCILKEGLESICRTHFVKGSKLYTNAYGNPCSVHIDPIEKKPLFHFLPATPSFSIATAGCNLACLNCQNWEISQRSPAETVNSELFPAQVVEQAAANKCRSIAYTYSEPIAFYEYMYDTAKIAKARGIKNLFISNGFINEKPLRDLAKVIDAANINLKSFSEETYAKLNGGSLQPVLDTLKILKEEGVWLEITNLVVPTWTDKPAMISEMCNWLVKNGFSETPLHFSRFHPLYKLTSLPFTPVTILNQARDIAMKAGIKYVYIGNVPGTPAESTYCAKCKNVVIERKGFSIVAMRMKNGACQSCGNPVSGIWS